MYLLPTCWLGAMRTYHIIAVADICGAVWRAEQQSMAGVEPYEMSVELPQEAWPALCGAACTAAQRAAHDTCVHSARGCWGHSLAAGATVGAAKLQT